MSIYSGFATRSLEESYYQCLVKVLSLMQSCVLSMLKHTRLKPGKWTNEFRKTFDMMEYLEGAKHLQPRFSEYVSELANTIEVQRFESAKVEFPSELTPVNEVTLPLMRDSPSVIRLRRNQNVLRSKSSFRVPKKDEFLYFNRFFKSKVQSIKSIIKRKAQIYKPRNNEE